MSTETASWAADGADRVDDGDHVDVVGDRVVLRLTVTDTALARHLSDVPDQLRAEAVIRVLAVGVRGLETMGVGVSVAQVGEEVDRVLAGVAAEAESRTSAIIEAGRRSLAECLDPAQRDSVTARTISEVRAAHADLLSRIDPDNGAGHTGRLVARLGDLLGPSGLLEQRLAAALDTDSEGSAFARLRDTLDGGFRELRDLLVADTARRTEAERGTAKGVDFEGRVESLLRREAAGIGGASVDVTATSGGSLGRESRVGDFVITLASGKRIVVEAKNTTSLGLRGKGGVLDELDRAMANRDAEFAVCVSAVDAFPSEVGVFAAYGNRLLVVDDGTGTLLAGAIRWAAAAVGAADTGRGDAIDVSALGTHLDRVRDLATRISNAKRALTTIRGSVDQVRDELDMLRSDLLDGIDDAVRSLQRGGDGTVAAIDQMRAKRSSPATSGPTRVAISSKSSYG